MTLNRDLSIQLTWTCIKKLITIPVITWMSAWSNFRIKSGWLESKYSFNCWISDFAAETLYNPTSFKPRFSISLVHARIIYGHESPSRWQIVRNETPNVFRWSFSSERWRLSRLKIENIKLLKLFINSLLGIFNRHAKFKVARHVNFFSNFRTRFQIWQVA